MATTTTKKKDAETPAAAEASTAPAAVIFRDKEFMSRTLFLPGERSLAVVGGRVTAPDADAQAYLAARPDFERLE